MGADLTHSPLGASSAERWMSCPGSVTLIKVANLVEGDEPEYRKKGTTAHALAARCLIEGCDAWEMFGQVVEGMEITGEIISAVQTYLDHVRPLMVPHAKVYIEERLSANAHAKMFGTVDFAAVTDSLLVIRDYKDGAGVVVEPENNPQFMYYAYLVLLKHDGVRRVSLGVIQPNAYHPDGPVRVWKTTAEHIHEWVNNTLLPAMHRAEASNDLAPGDWCRFCPAKLACPVLSGLFGAAIHADPKKSVDLSDAALAASYRLVGQVKSYCKALDEEVMRRMTAGHVIAGQKLVCKKGNRVWKDDAKAVVVSKFGDDAFTTSELKSPAEIDKLPDGKALTKEYAYSPETGLTVAPEDDKRLAIKAQTSQQAFAKTIDQLTDKV